MKRFHSIRIFDGECEFVSAEEEIARVVAGVKADLEYRGVTDPRVWGDGLPPYAVNDGEGEAEIREDIGMFGEVERTVRGDPSGGMAEAVERAFELGRTSIVGKPGNGEAIKFVDAHKRRIDGAKKSGDKTGGEKQAAIAESERVMKEVWRAYRSQFGSDRALAEGMRDRKCKYMDAGRERVFVPHVKIDRARALFGEWACEEKWAAGWVVVDGECRQDTHDNYRVRLFQEDGGWRLRIEARNGKEWTLKRSYPLEKAKDAGYRIIEMLREKARDEARYRKTYDWEDQA